MFLSVILKRRLQSFKVIISHTIIIPFGKLIIIKSSKHYGDGTLPKQEF